MNALTQCSVMPVERFSEAPTLPSLFASSAFDKQSPDIKGRGQSADAALTRPLSALPYLVSSGNYQALSSK